MRYLNDPRQNRLFDVFEEFLSDVAYRRLTSGWQQLFRASILDLMPAGELAEHFHPEPGRPTKEVYSMAGLIFMMEFRDWTHEEAADAYMFNVDVQFALNLSPETQSRCRRTIERYIALFRSDELAAGIMHEVTAKLVEMLQLDVSKQCLDSTHIEWNMARFGRIKLMATTIRRFLHQIKRHDEGSYNALKRSVRDRYEANPNSLLGWKKLDSDETNSLRQIVAEDLAWLVERYRRNKNHNSRSTYLMLVKVFEQQCEVVDEKVTVKKKTGGNIVCNPSVPDATFDGHKGSGYQVQLCETYSDINNVQLITAAIPETACESDSHAISKIIDHFDEHGMRPDTVLADTAYGGDDNFMKCARDSSLSYWGPTNDEGTTSPVIKLLSPTSGRRQTGRPFEGEQSSAGDSSGGDSAGSDNKLTQSKPKDDDERLLTILDFQYDQTSNRFTGCPAGHELHRAHYREYEDQHVLLMLGSNQGPCQKCSLRTRCPMPYDSMFCDLRVNGKDLRLAQRRAAEDTEEFQGRVSKARRH